MTVRELYNWCKAQRNKDAEVFMCKDWEQVDEDGYLTDLYRLNDITTQTHYVETGMDFMEIHEVILEFESQPATARINNDMP